MTTTTTRPFAGRQTRNIRQDHRDESRCSPNSRGYCACSLELAPEAEAELVCSDLPELGDDGDTRTRRHLPVIDLDFPARLVPSATEGHFHLYLDKAVTWHDYVAVLESLTRAGLVEYGYLDATKERGFGSLRHPDRPKPKPGEAPY